MKRNLLGMLSILLTLNSCNNRVRADFEITNSTGIKIDSLKIEPMVNSKGKFISLEPNEKAEYKVDMTGISKIDGSYRLTYQHNRETIIKNFGYYTNGYPLEKITKIEIKRDTILIDQVFIKY